MERRNEMDKDSLKFLSREYKKDKKSLSEKIVFIVAFIILLAYAILVAYFFFYGLSLALLGDAEAYEEVQFEGKLWIPQWDKISFKAFYEALFNLTSSTASLKDFSFLQLTWNSIWRTTLYSTLSIFTSCCVCYILVFYRSRLTKFIYNLGLFVSIIPLFGSAASTYQLYSNFLGTGIDLKGTVTLVTITSIGLYGGYFFYMYSFFKSLSWEYAEAAFVDGANHYKVFFRIMLPMALPSVSALFIMNFIMGWNDYENTLLYMQKYPNLSFASYLFANTNSNNVPVFMAATFVSLIPMLILFLIFQNSIMEKVHLGGLKG